MPVSVILTGFEVVVAALLSLAVGGVLLPGDLIVTICVYFSGSSAGASVLLPESSVAVYVIA